VLPLPDGASPSYSNSFVNPPRSLSFVRQVPARRHPARHTDNSDSDCLLLSLESGFRAARANDEKDRAPGLEQNIDKETDEESVPSSVLPLPGRGIVQNQADGDMAPESDAQSENDPLSCPDRFCRLLHYTHPFPVLFHPPAPR